MYFGHHLSTIEGGFINTNDEDFYHLLLMMRSHGWDRDLPECKQKELRGKYNCSDFDALYNFYVPGMNLRSTDLQAFIGLRVIDRLDDYANKRRDNFFKYKDLIKHNNIKLEERDGDFISSFAIPIVNGRRTELVEKLQKANIEVRPLIAGNMANKPMWLNEYKSVKLRNCEVLDIFGFYIPNHQDLSEEDIKTITKILNLEE